MRKIIEPLRSRRAGIALVCVLITGVMVLLLGPSSVAQAPQPFTAQPGGSGGGMAVTPAPTPPRQAPAVRERPLAPLATTNPPAPVPTGKTKPAPTLSAADAAALAQLNSWWKVFTTSIKKNKRGTQLTAMQLKQPRVVVVTKPSCKQPASNALGPKSRKALTYCNGKLEFVPSVFRTITKGGKLKVVASGFLYHALATTKLRQRLYETGVARNNTQVLGCLQATLSVALHRNGVVDTEADAWAVMQDNLGGGDLHNSYFATADNGGRWS